MPGNPKTETRNPKILADGHQAEVRSPKSKGLGLTTTRAEVRVPKVVVWLEYSNGGARGSRYSCASR
jgi:hypothetical protein